MPHFMENETYTRPVDKAGEMYINDPAHPGKLKPKARKGEHTTTYPCKTPHDMFKRPGSLWMCPECKQLWVLVKTSYQVGKYWEKVNLND